MATIRGTAAVLIIGTVGSGKTSTANSVGEILAAQETPHAIVDLDWLRNAWPPRPADPFNTELELENLAAVSLNFRSRGAQRLVLAGVIEDPSMRARYERALGIPLVICRLKVDLEVARLRLESRHHRGDDLDWHLARLKPLHEILEAAQIEDYLVQVRDETPAGVAHAALKTIGWLE